MAQVDQEKSKSWQTSAQRARGRGFGAGGGGRRSAAGARALLLSAPAAGTSCPAGYFCLEVSLQLEGRPMGPTQVLDAPEMRLGTLCPRPKEDDVHSPGMGSEAVSCAHSLFGPCDEGEE